MGSVAVSEVVNDTHPWTNMLDARAHHPDHAPYDTSYQNSSPQPPRQPNSSHSPRSSPSTIAPSYRPSHAPTSGTPIRSTSGQAPSHSRQTTAVETSQQDVQHPPSTLRHSPSPARPLAASKSASLAMDAAPAPGSDRETHSSSPPQSSSPSDSPPRIRVRDLQHIQSFAGEDLGSYSASPGTDQGSSTPPQYEISDMPIGDVIEMVAGLLTKITTTNDQHHDHLHRQIPPPEAAANLSPTTSSVLAFHGKNVPSITILSYLSRIHKYCPATWEVFLSLLVYFDRMTERVNAGPIQSLRQADQDFNERSERRFQAPRPQRTATTAQSERTRVAPGQRSLASTDSHPSSSFQGQSQPPPSPSLSDPDSCSLAHFFVVDSFNIHRLVIAGVTCAAKYFSDIFFTNSRYAKVGGLPLLELNHLELQFLLLNDFRLAVPVEELEAYATMLVEFYAREVVAQRQTEGMDGVEWLHADRTIPQR